MQEMQETWVPSLGQEDPLEEEMATCCSILAWRIPWTEEPSRHVSGSERRVYTKNELNDYAISNYGSLEALVKHKQEAGEFVEVQVWNLQKW